MPALPPPPPDDAPAVVRLGYALRVRREAMPGIRNRQSLADLLDYSWEVVRDVENGRYGARLQRYLTRWEERIGLDPELEDLWRQVRAETDQPSVSGELPAVRAGGPDGVGASPRAPAERSGELDDIVMVTADESAGFLAWAEATNVGALTIEQLHEELRHVARAYLQLPIMSLLHRTRLIRNRAVELLGGRQRPAHTRELYVTAGWSLTLLAWMATDLGRPDAARTQAHAALVCADYADHPPLRAWIRAAQHTAAYWEGDSHAAAAFAEDGLHQAVGGAEVFLASALAIDLARLGRVEHARVALSRARATAETTTAETTTAGAELGGPLTCTLARAAGIWTDVLLTLGDFEEALRVAEDAVAASVAMPPEDRNHGTERMARLHQARAHLLLGRLDAAEEALGPVLATAPPHRVQPLLRRAGEVGMLLSTPDYVGSPLARTLGERLVAFQSRPAVKELTT